MFEIFAEPTLTDRLRKLCLVPLTAYLLTETYFTFASWLPSARWPLSALRLLLLAGATAGLGGASYLAWKHRDELGWAAAGWLAVVAAPTLVCLYLFAALAAVPLFPWSG